MKKTKIILFTILTAFAGVYVFSEAPTLNPLYFDGALFWATLVTVYLGLWGLLKIGELTFNTSAAANGQTPFTYNKKGSMPKILKIVIAVPWLFIGIMIIYGTVLFQWKAYRDQLGNTTVRKFTNEIQAVDTSQIPIVDEDLALKLANKKLGERPSLGSQVYLRDATIQMVDGKLVWVAPLYHSGFFKWFMNMEGTPGYIIVSATNVNDVQYVEGFKIKYHPGSYLLFDVARKVRFGPGLMDGITDYSFELNDDGTPYWVISTYKNLKGFNLPEATGVILLNATTGEIEKYTIENVPKWIDRVQPESFILNQINNKGNYVKGIFNFSDKDKYKTSQGHNIVYNNEKCYLFTGLTSVGSDESAIGFMMVDMVTKEPILYEMSGATEYAAMSSAEGKVQDLKYWATFPIILNIDSQPTYFMTLKDGAGLIKQYAFVSVVNYSSVGTGESVTEALRDYEAKLRGDGIYTDFTNAGEGKDIQGTVLRIAAEVTSETTVYKIILAEHKDMIFAAPYSLSEELALTQVGDKVSITYSVSGSSAQIVIKFDNLEFSQKT